MGAEQHISIQMDEHGKTLIKKIPPELADLKIGNRVSTFNFEKLGATVIAHWDSLPAANVEAVQNAIADFVANEMYTSGYNETTSRLQEEIRRIDRDKRLVPWYYILILIALALVAIVISIFSVPENSIGDFIHNSALNFATEMMGAAITFWFLQIAYDRTDQKIQRKQEEAQTALQEIFDNYNEITEALAEEVGGSVQSLLFKEKLKNLISISSPYIVSSIPILLNLLSQVQISSLDSGDSDQLAMGDESNKVTDE